MFDNEIQKEIERLRKENNGLKGDSEILIGVMLVFIQPRFDGNKFSAWSMKSFLPISERSFLQRKAESLADAVQ